MTTVVTSCRKCFTIILSALLFGHVLTGFHVAGVASVFAGVLLNANLDLRCSRVVLLPTLCLMALVCYALVGQPPQGGLLVFGLLKDALATPLYQPAQVSIKPNRPE